MEAQRGPHADHRGPFNKELIERVALLVLENLTVLCPADDPGVLLELMPARGREAAGWADGELTASSTTSPRSRKLLRTRSADDVPLGINLHPPGSPADLAFGATRRRGPTTGRTRPWRRCSGVRGSRCTWRRRKPRRSRNGSRRSSRRRSSPGALRRSQSRARSSGWSRSARA